MTFTKAKQEFDAQYGNAVDFHCFIQEHLTFNKVVSFRKKDGTKMSNITNGNFCMLLYTLAYTLKII